VPADFRQWCHGYIISSHKAQGWTAGHLVVAAERLTSNGAYVTCSRGRRSCIIHTPDKARLIVSSSLNTTPEFIGIDTDAFRLANIELR
jgi:ATP-dependent exoDNAse (exonuclease V) alpha subunit